MARTDKMKLGTFVYTFGFHPASWLHPASDVHGANDFSHLLDVAKRSEAAKLDFMFMADSPAAAVGDPDALARIPTKMNRFEPLSLLAALAVTTEKLGLVATVSTSYYEPYNRSAICLNRPSEPRAGMLERRYLGPRRDGLQFQSRGAGSARATL